MTPLRANSGSGDSPSQRGNAGATGFEATRTGEDVSVDVLLAERARIDAQLRAAMDNHTRHANELFGRNLKRLREAKGLTQQALAERIGLERTSVTNQEAGRQGTPWATLLLLADALDVSLDEFRISHD